jgi:glycosyltransferase involved in cell wall biosynthesis
MPTISVVIPSYNRAHLLRRCVQSALNQTFAPAEIIIADDKSTDDTRALVQSWQAGEPRIRLVTLEVNSGPAAARNRGVAEARGEFVAFLDSDDTWDPDHLRSCIDFLQARPELDLVFGDLRRITEDGRVLHASFLLEHKRIDDYLVQADDHAGWYTFATPEAEALLQQYVVPIQTAVLRRDLALQFPFDPAIFGPEDYDFVLRLTRAGKRFGFVNAVHCDCYIHESNILSNGRSELRGSLEERKVWSKLLRDPTLSQDERRLVQQKLARLHLDEAYFYRRVRRWWDAIHAHCRSLRAAYSWPALRGLALSCLLPVLPAKSHVGS